MGGTAGIAAVQQHSRGVFQSAFVGHGASNIAAEEDEDALCLQLLQQVETAFATGTAAGSCN